MIPAEAFEQPIVFTVIAIVVVTLPVVSLIILSRFGKLKSISRNGIDFADDTAPKKKRGAHGKCRHRADVVTVFRNRDKYLARINVITTRELPVEIMNHAEDVTDNLLSMLESRFLTLIKDKKLATKAEVASTQYFREYRVILGVIRPHLLAESRRMLRENGWIKKEREGTWDGYVKGKIQDFLQLFTRKMNDYYFMDEPTRTEVYDANMQLVNNVAPGGFIPALEAGLRSMLTIVKSHHREIAEIEAKMDGEFEELLS